MKIQIGGMDDTARVTLTEGEPMLELAVDKTAIVLTVYPDAIQDISVIPTAIDQRSI